jgi:hypothetical protein
VFVRIDVSLCAYASAYSGNSVAPQVTPRKTTAGGVDAPPWRGLPEPHLDTSINSSFDLDLLGPSIGSESLEDAVVLSRFLAVRISRHGPLRP